MIDPFTSRDVSELVRNENPPCVTFYLETERTGREIYKSVSRLKNQLELARNKLTGHWMSEVDAKQFLHPVEALLENEGFWEQTELGLAIFLDADQLRFWRSGTPYVQRTYVSRQFFVRPVLATTMDEVSYYVLALSQNKAELFQVSGANVDKLSVPGMPSSLEAMMNLTSVDRGAQVHTGSRELGGKESGVFHGHGGKPDAPSEDFWQYSRQVNDSVARFLKDQQGPLVLACVAEHAPIYHQVNTCPLLLGETAFGSPDHLTDAQLVEKVREIPTKHAEHLRQNAFGACREMEDTNRVVTETSTLLAAAHQGQVDKLFVSELASLPGEFDFENQTVSYDVSADCDADLVEDAIRQTLLHRGEVHIAKQQEMPSDSMMIATLRY